MSTPEIILSGVLFLLALWVLYLHRRVNVLAFVLLELLKGLKQAALEVERQGKTPEE